MACRPLIQDDVSPIAPLGNHEPPDWVVVDVQIPGEYEVIAGPRPGGGRALRRALRGAAARLVPPVIATVVQTHTPYDEVSKPLQDVTYRINAIPAIGPFGAVNAVLCCICPVGETMPAPPLVGAWQWDIPTRTGHGTTALFDMFETPPQLRKPYGMAQYLARITVPSTPDALGLWARATTAESEDVLYEKVVRNPADGAPPRRYMMCGRPVFGDGAEPVAFRGVTIDITNLPQRGAPAPAADLLVAVLGHLELSLAVVDARHLHVLRWLTSPPTGLCLPRNVYFADVVHPDDRSELDRAWAEVDTLLPGDEVRTMVRVPGEEAEWVRVQLAARMYLRSETSTQLMVAIRVLDP
jgi:hypothetical protein